MNMTNKTLGRALLACVLTAALWAQGAVAQEAPADNDGWSNTFILYLLGPTLDGTVGIGPADGDVDMNAGDVFSMLDAAFLGLYAGEGERWGVVSEVIYMDLREDDISGPAGFVTGEVGNTQTTAMVSASYRLTEHLRLLGGVMYNKITADIRLYGPVNSRYAKTSESWADPVVGILYNTSLSDRWSFTGMAQVGGGVGADLVYTLTASLAWHFGERTSMTLGYRYLDFDYEDGEGRGRFKFDMKQHGPALGLKFDF